MCALIVSVPDHCLSFYFVIFRSHPTLSCFVCCVHVFALK